MRTILLLASLLLVACEKVAPTTTGPVPLRDAAHMQSYLAGSEHGWKLWDVDGVEQQWTFSPDARFSAWIAGETDQDLASLLSDEIPAGVTRLGGTWEVTTTELILKRLRTGSGEAVDDLVLPLAWVDGKLRLRIAGHSYMRSMSGPATGDAS